MEITVNIAGTRLYLIDGSVVSGPFLNLTALREFVEQRAHNVEDDAKSSEYFAMEEYITAILDGLKHSSTIPDVWT